VRTRAGADLPPGDYLIRLREDGSVNLQQVGGQLTIPLAPVTAARMDSDGGGGIFSCLSGYRLSFEYRNCQVCITLECPGQWVYLLGCFEIPFCNVVTGLFDVWVD